MVVLLLSCGLIAFTPLQNLENTWGLPSLYLLRGERPACPQITLIAINQQAAKNLGLAPQAHRWPRGLHGELVQRLHVHGARLVAFDLLFDRTKDAHDDAVFAQALRDAGNVVLVAYLQRETLHTGNARATLDQLTPPALIFASAALATAPFALVKSPHGVQAYLRFAPQGSQIPSLPLVLAQQLGEKPVAGSSDDPEITTLNLYGPPEHFRTLPYDQALNLLAQGGPGAEIFRGGMVFIGASEPNQPEQRDVYATPWSTAQGVDVSGVELAATALCNQLDGSVLKRLSPLQEAGLLMLLAALWLAPWCWLRTRGAALCGVGLATGYALVAVWIFSRWHWALPLALPLLLVWPAAHLLGLAGQLRRAEQQRQRLQHALDRYGPREEIARLALTLRSADEAIHVACLCTDIANYTPQMEDLSAAQAQAWLNHYFEIVFPIVRAHGGHVVDHAGDAMVCIWLCTDKPHASCLAAHQAALALHAELQKTPAYTTRIGLHFGPVALGEVGDAQHAEQRVVGDIVNTTSRIQTANKALGTQVLLSGAIAAQLPSSARRALGPFLLKGKTQLVELHEALPTDPQLTQRYALALAALRSGHPSDAASILDALLRDHPTDGPARYFRQQLTDFERQVYPQNPPPREDTRGLFFSIN
jgi:adenylate cyclase